MPLPRIRHKGVHVRLLDGPNHLFQDCFSARVVVIVVLSVGIQLVFQSCPLMGQRASITPQQGLDTSHPTTQPLPCELELDEYLKCLKR